MNVSEYNIRACPACLPVGMTLAAACPASRVLGICGVNPRSVRESPRGIRLSPRNKGFTLIEVLLVIGLISALAAIVIIAVNPARQFAQARNTQRWSNINTILNASHQYAISNRGRFPTAITATPTEVCKTDALDCAGLVDLSVFTDDQTYIVSMPVDPSCPEGPGAPLPACNANGAGYKISKNANGRITVEAPQNELSEIISVTR